MSEGIERPGFRLWKRVTEAQQDRGWSLGELMEKSGVHRNTIRDLQTIKGLPQTKTVNALAKALDIPVREAFKLAGLDPETAMKPEVATVGEATPGSGPDLEPEYSQLDELLASLPERERERYERMHAEERKRYELMREQVRKDYERGVSRIREIAQLEIKNTRKPGGEDGDE